MTPLEYLLSVMQDEATDRDRRDKIAMALLPCCHSKPTPAETPGNYEYSTKPTNEAWLLRLHRRSRW